MAALQILTSVYSSLDRLCTTSSIAERALVRQNGARGRFLSRSTPCSATKAQTEAQTTMRGKFLELLVLLWLLCHSLRTPHWLQVAKALVERVSASPTQNPQFVEAKESGDGKTSYTFEFLTKASNYTRHGLGTVAIKDGARLPSNVPLEAALCSTGPSFSPPGIVQHTLTLPKSFNSL